MEPLRSYTSLGSVVEVELDARLSERILGADSAFIHDQRVGAASSEARMPEPRGFATQVQAGYSTAMLLSK